jgi:hypothetical protein
MAPKNGEQRPETTHAACSLAENETKLCTLCGTLNHQRNRACFLCCWRGAFSQDPAAIHLAWRRLCDEFGVVGFEHVDGRHFRSVARVARRRRRQTVASLTWLRRFVAWRRSLSASPDTRLRVVAWLLQ